MCVLEQQLASAGHQAAGCCLLLLCAPPHRLKLESSCRPILCCLAELCRQPALAACQHGVQLQARISSTTHPEPGQHRQRMWATVFLHRGHSRVRCNCVEARCPTQDSAGSCLLATRARGEPRTVSAALHPAVENLRLIRPLACTAPGSKAAHRQQQRDQTCALAPCTSCCCRPVLDAADSRLLLPAGLLPWLLSLRLSGAA